jgi:hypothetical protein
MRPVSDLDPAASQPEGVGSELHNYCGNSAILDPHIRFRLVSTDYDAEGGFLEKIGALLFRLRQSKEHIRIVDKYKRPGISIAGRGAPEQGLFHQLKGLRVDAPLFVAPDAPPCSQDIDHGVPPHENRIDLPGQDRLTNNTFLTGRQAMKK